MGYVTDLKLPRLGETMETGRITQWCVTPGEKYQRGQRLLELETDKTIVEVPALQEGHLIEILADVDAVISVGESIARVELAGEAPLPEKTKGHEVTSNTDLSSDPPIRAQDFHPIAKTGVKRFVTPRARHAADQHRLNLESVTGTGRRGRIVYNDVLDAVKQQPLSVNVSTTTELVDTTHGQLHHTWWNPATVQHDVVIVMMHGLFSDGQVWVDSATNLARLGFRVCAVDLPGHGNTLSQVTKPRDIASAVAESLRKTAGEICLVGHSFGALIAAHVAGLLDARIQALKLIAPVGLGRAINQPFLDGMSRPVSIEDVGECLRQLDVAGQVPDAAFTEALLLRLQRDSDQLSEICTEIAKSGIQQSDIRQELIRLSCDITILWGREDKILSWKDALNAPAQSSLHLVSGVGHLPHLERQSLLLELVMPGSSSFRAR